MAKISFIPPESYKFILAPILLAIFCNIILYALRWSNKKNVKPATENTKFSKYGYIIGIIWTIIFGFMGYTYYLLYKASNKYFTPATIAIILYLIFSLSYPFTTSRFMKFTDILNVISLLLACILIIIVGYEYWMGSNKKSLKIVLYLMPLFLWLLFVNITFGSFSKINNIIYKI